MAKCKQICWWTGTTHSLLHLQRCTHSDTPRNVHGGYLNPPHNSTGIAIDMSAFKPGLRQRIDLSLYEPCKLNPAQNVELRPCEDRTIHLEDLQVYRNTVGINWKIQEGIILYYVTEPREFWNCIISYHGPAQSTGIREWDKLFHTLQLTCYTKNLIPCMVCVFLVMSWELDSDSGCMDRDCLFLRDHDAVLASRAQVLVKRRATFRVRHRYKNTRGVSKTGTAGTGTVVHFNTPQYTTYPYRGIAGMHWYIPKGNFSLYFIF